jgi:hypothetical protein
VLQKYPAPLTFKDIQPHDIGKLSQFGIDEEVVRFERFFKFGQPK